MSSIWNDSDRNQQEVEPFSPADWRTGGRLTKRLSQRELEVVHYAIQGLTGEKIAKEMLISYETVKDHKAHAIRKLEARNYLHAVAMILQER